MTNRPEAVANIVRATLCPHYITLARYELGWHRCTWCETRRLIHGVKDTRPIKKAA